MSFNLYVCATVCDLKILSFTQHWSQLFHIVRWGFGTQNLAFAMVFLSLLFKCMLHVSEILLSIWDYSDSQQKYL